MVIVMIRLRAKPEHLEDFVRESIVYVQVSVKEPGCRRFDIAQDGADPTRFGWCEVYDSDEAFLDHKNSPHMIRFREIGEDWLGEGVGGGFSKCEPIFPLGDDVHWDSVRESAVEDAVFHRGLYIVHAPLLVNPDRREDFIDATRLTAIGSINEEPGCLRFDVHQNSENPDQLYVYEVCVNKAAFDYHTRTPHTQKWIETVNEWYAPEFSPENSPDFLRGCNLWPPDNWHWRSTHP